RIVWWSFRRSFRCSSLKGALPMTDRHCGLKTELSISPNANVHQRHSRFTKRNEPPIPSSDHCTLSSNGATNISNTRRLSAPYLSQMSSGETTLPLLLDIRVQRQT